MSTSKNLKPSEEQAAKFKALAKEAEADPSEAAFKKRLEKISEKKKVPSTLK